MDKSFENLIESRLNNIEGMLRILLKQKYSNKCQSIIDEIIRRGRMSSREIVEFLGISKTWALKLMAKIGNNPDFRFVEGDIKRKRNALLIYSKNENRLKNLTLIKNKIEKKKIITFHELMMALKLDINALSELAYDFIAENKEYEIFEENKIRKKL